MFCLGFRRNGKSMLLMTAKLQVGERNGLDPRVQVIGKRRVVGSGMRVRNEKLNKRETARKLSSQRMVSEWWASCVRAICDERILNRY